MATNIISEEFIYCSQGEYTSFLIYIRIVLIIQFIMSSIPRRSWGLVPGIGTKRKTAKRDTLMFAQ